MSVWGAPPRASIVRARRGGRRRTVISLPAWFWPERTVSAVGGGRRRTPSPLHTREVPGSIPGAPTANSLQNAIFALSRACNSLLHVSRCEIGAKLALAGLKQTEKTCIHGKRAQALTQTACDSRSRIICAVRVRARWARIGRVGQG